jgi:hypothetical protein
VAAAVAPAAPVTAEEVSGIADVVEGSPVGAFAGDVFTAASSGSELGVTGVVGTADSVCFTGAPQFGQNLFSLFKGEPQFSQKLAMIVSSSLTVYVRLNMKNLSTE